MEEIGPTHGAAALPGCASSTTSLMATRVPLMAARVPLMAPRVSLMAARASLMAPRVSLMAPRVSLMAPRVPLMAAMAARMFFDFMDHYILVWENICEWTSCCMYDFHVQFVVSPVGEGEQWAEQACRHVGKFVGAVRPPRCLRYVRLLRCLLWRRVRLLWRRVCLLWRRVRLLWRRVRLLWRRWRRE